MKEKTCFIALVGLPNAGKSTLLNSLIGHKVSIVSPKPQTTRDRILGILTENGAQFVFVDTPGVQKPKNVLGQYMAKTTENASDGADAVLLCIDAHEREIGEKEIALVEKYIKKGLPTVVAVTKTDICQPERLMPSLARLNGVKGIDAVFAVSAKKNRNVEQLRAYLGKFLKEGAFYFPEDEVSDRNLRFLASEIIREKILLALDDEIPHGTAIELNKFDIDEQTGLYRIDANIYVEKASHKPIIIGKGGSMLKEIGTRARLAMEERFGGKVFLELWIKIKDNWRDDARVLKLVGYEIEK